MTDFANELVTCKGCLAGCAIFILCPTIVCVGQIGTVKAATNIKCCVPYCLLCYCNVFGAAINRSLIRKGFKIKRTLCSDCISWICCSPCAFFQEIAGAQSRSDFKLMPILTQLNSVIDIYSKVQQYAKPLEISHN